MVSSHKNRCKISRNSRSRAGRITRGLFGTVVLRNQILTLPDYPRIGARSQGTYVIFLTGLMFRGGNAGRVRPLVCSTRVDFRGRTLFIV